jgi:hypothetical protein
MRRTCIFCGEKADSKEDAWPEWVLELLGRDASTVIVMQFPKGTFKQKGKNAGVKTRRVCRFKCNSGWMSDLENSCKPVMVPLIQGRNAKLGDGDRFKVALWALKTCMVFDSLLPNGPHYFSQADRQRLPPGPGGLFETNPFPQFFFVWCARYIGKESIFTESYIMHADAYASDSKEQMRIDGHAFTIAIGKLVLQVLSASIPPKKVRKVTEFHPNSRAWDTHIRKVWPILGASIDWPIPEVLDDSTMSLDGFSHRWHALPAEWQTSPGT